jgi:hypothetical protein
MPKVPKIKLAADYLLKLSEIATEQSEIPAEAPVEETAEDAEIEQILSQLSPEQLEMLAAELADDINNPGDTSSGNTAALAQAIQESLGQNPEASVPSADAGAQEAAEIFKSAEYIEGFLNQAKASGVSVKKAVDLYDQVLTNVLGLAKSAKAKNKHEEEETAEEEKAEHESGEEPLEKIKKIAYYKGVLDEALYQGVELEDALSLIKDAELKDTFRKLYVSTRKGARDIGKSLARGEKAVGEAINAGARKASVLGRKGARDFRKSLDRGEKAVGEVLDAGVRKARILGRKGVRSAVNFEKAIDAVQKPIMKHRYPMLDAKENPFKFNKKRNPSTQKTKTRPPVRPEGAKKKASLEQLLHVLSKPTLRKLESQILAGTLHNPGSFLSAAKGMNPKAFKKAIQQLEHDLAVGARPRPQSRGGGGGGGGKGGGGKGGGG